MDDTLQPDCAPYCPRRDAVGERLAENPPGAASGSTPEPADLDAQMDDRAVRRQVHEPPMIPTMNLRRSQAAFRAGCIGRGRSRRDEQMVSLGGDRLNQKTGRRDRLV
jgi:hypothetical protein